MNNTMAILDDIHDHTVVVLPSDQLDGLVYREQQFVAFCREIGPRDVVLACLGPVLLERVEVSSELQVQRSVQQLHRSGTVGRTNETPLQCVVNNVADTWCGH